MNRYGLGLSGGLGLALAVAASMGGAKLERIDPAPTEPTPPAPEPPVDVAVVEEEAARIALADTPLEHVCLGGKVPGVANAAAQRIHAQGGSPRAQIDAARSACNKGLKYTPHQGQKERLKRAKRMAAAGG